MRRTWMIGSLVLALALLSAACDTGTDESTTTAGGDTTTTLTGDTSTGDGDEELSALLLDAQAQAIALADDVAAVSDSPQLQEAWAALMANVDALVADVASGDGDAVRGSLDEVGVIIDDLGDEAAADLRPAWEEFRQTIENILDAFGL